MIMRFKIQILHRILEPKVQFTRNIINTFIYLKLVVSLFSWADGQHLVY